jgi:hypothetical protein
VSFISGFGNNLYQLAAAYELEQIGYRVFFDFSNVGKRSLEILEIPEIARFVRHRTIPLSRYFPSVIGRRSSLGKFVFGTIFRLTLWTDLTGLGQLPTKKDVSYLITGYWSRLSVAQKLPPQNFFQRETILDKVAIHVRRGDMIGNIQNPMDEFFRSCTFEIIRRNPTRNLKFFVYTDDPEYCLHTLDIGVKFTVVRNETTLSDFCGLIESEFLIMSRSTFSWWAGFFSNATVFSPSPFESSQVLPEDQILPIRWEKVFWKI